MPAVAAAQAPGVAGASELALAQALKHLYLADAQHHQVGMAVAVDIERVRRDGIGQLEAGTFFHELDRPAARTAVAIELGLVDTTRHVHLGQAVAVAVKARHAAADHELGLAFEAHLQPGRISFFDEARHLGRDLRCRLRCR